MPYFLATGAHFYTIKLFRSRVSGASGALLPLDYEEIGKAGRRKNRGVIFGDIDRLTGRSIERMTRFYNRISKTLPTGAILNHPTRSMRRYELLRNLNERGINGFNVHRLSEARQPERYPVFLRRDSGHDGAATEPLPDRAAVDREIEKMLDAGAPRDDILMVEYLDYRSPDERFRKYGAYLVGDRFVPYQIEISENWVVKLPAIVDSATIAEELAYVTGKHEHEGLLREVFRIAGIQYGRIDYAMVDGKPQIFEINTNPVIIGPRSKVRERRPVFEHAIPRILRGFKAIDALARTVPRARPARRAGS